MAGSAVIDVQRVWDDMGRELNLWSKVLVMRWQEVCNSLAAVTGYLPLPLPLPPPLQQLTDRQDDIDGRTKVYEPNLDICAGCVVEDQVNSFVHG